MLRDGFVVLMEIFSTPRKQCQLEYSPSVCPASSIFHFFSKNPLGYRECCRNPHTHANEEWRRLGSCRLELQIWGQGTELNTSEHEVHLLQVSVRSPYLDFVTLYSNNRCALCRQGCASSARPFIRQLLFLVQAHGFPVVSMKTILFWKNFWSNRFETFSM